MELLSTILTTLALTLLIWKNHVQDKLIKVQRLLIEEFKIHNKLADKTIKIGEKLIKEQNDLILEQGKALTKKIIKNKFMNIHLN